MEDSAPTAIDSTSNADARARFVGRGLGLIGTLLLHAIIAQWLIVGAGARVAWVSDLRPGLGSSALVLVNSSDAEASENQRARWPDSQRIALRMISPHIEPDLLPDLESADMRLAGAESTSRSDQSATLDLCHRIYRDEADLMRDVAHLSLRGTGIPGGPITDANVDISGGDRSRALLALRCLQAFGTLPPVAQLN